MQHTYGGWRGLEGTAELAPRLKAEGRGLKVLDPVVAAGLAVPPYLDRFVLLTHPEAAFHLDLLAADHPAVGR